MKTISNTFQAPGKRAWFTASSMCAWKFVYWFILFIAYYVAFYTAHTVERLLMNTFVSGMLYLRLPSRNPVFFFNSNPTQSGQFHFKIVKNNLLKLEVSYADIAWLFIFICQIIGKRPNSDVWVFNADVQMDGSGNVIPLEQKKFILEVVNVPTGKPNDWINLTACT